MLDVRIATLNDLPEVMSVLDDAAAWLQAIGVSEQWPASFSSDPAWVERFTRWTAEGRVFVARDADGSAVGSFRLLDADHHIWSERGSALYLHSLAVVRRAAGQGVAKTMLDWALGYSSREGVDELRLDCWAGNQRLVRYYADAGFEPRGESHVVEGEGGQWSMTEYWVAKFAWRLR